MATTENPFEKASEQTASFRHWCPECDDRNALFRYQTTETDDCCEGGARRRFECAACGFPKWRAAVDFEEGP